MEKGIKDLIKCPKCEKPLVPDRKAIDFEAKKWGIKRWDGHTYKVGCDCNCMKKGVRINIG